MDAATIQKAAALLADARRTMRPLPGLPAELRPATVAAAHAIQDATTALLGLTVGAFKASAPRDGEPTRGVIHTGTILPSPADFPAATAPACGVEAEVAFRFRKDFPPRDRDYLRHDVAAGVDALVAIEVVHSRYGALINEPGRLSEMEKLADSISNGGLVVGTPVSPWTATLHHDLTVTLTVNDQVVVQQKGGHPTGDPFAAAVALVNLMRTGAGVKAGQYVTCGSWTGLRFLNPGDTCVARIEGLGEARLVFAGTGIVH